MLEYNLQTLKSSPTKAPPLAEFSDPSPSPNFSHCCTTTQVGIGPSNPTATSHSGACTTKSVNHSPNSQRFVSVTNP